MNSLYRLLLLFLLPCLPVLAQINNPVVRIQTSQGEFTLELDYTHSPNSVKNFLTYAKEGFYEGTIFHRLIPDFIMQGGGYTENYEKKDTHSPIESEADNEQKNLRGTVALARNANPHSATAQFFINLKDNDALDFKDKSAKGYGYTVFGTVTAGMEVIDKMAAIAVGQGGPFNKYLPQEMIVIQKVVIEQDLPQEEQDNLAEQPETPTIEPAVSTAVASIPEDEPKANLETNDTLNSATDQPATPVPLFAPEPPDLPATE